MRLLGLILILFAMPTLAEGFKQKNLIKVTPDLGAFSGGTFGMVRSQNRLTIVCETCSDMIAVDLKVGSTTDGTEARYRSGETKISSLEESCKAKAPDCRLTHVEVAGAVGWISVYNIGDGKGSTGILFQDGDVLTIRSLAPKADTASYNMNLAITNLAPQIVGP